MDIAIFIRIISSASINGTIGKSGLRLSLGLLRETRHKHPSVHIHGLCLHFGGGSTQLISGCSLLRISRCRSLWLGRTSLLFLLLVALLSIGISIGREKILRTLFGIGIVVARIFSCGTCRIPITVVIGIRGIFIGIISKASAALSEEPTSIRKCRLHGTKFLVVIVITAVAAASLFTLVATATTADDGTDGNAICGLVDTILRNCSFVLTIYVHLFLTVVVVITTTTFFLIVMTPLPLIFRHGERRHAIVVLRRSSSSCCISRCTSRWDKLLRILVVIAAWWGEGQGTSDEINCHNVWGMTGHGVYSTRRFT